MEGWYPQWLRQSPPPFAPGSTPQGSLFCQVNSLWKLSPALISYPSHHPPALGGVGSLLQCQYLVPSPCSLDSPSTLLPSARIELVFGLMAWAT